jgi:hypothetical protein
MVTLAKRASPSQARILRIVEGAVLNAADAHAKPRDEQFARSIAKRAAGTLTAQWPDVLAANSRPPKSGPAADGKCRACERRKHAALRRVRRDRVKLNNGAAADRLPSADQGAPSQFNRRRPLLELWGRLKREMWSIRRNGTNAQYEAHVHLLRMVHKMHKDMADDEIWAHECARLKTS